MASITGLCAKIINVVIYNYMVICGEIQQYVPFNEQIYHSQFVKFNSPMIRVDFFRDYYNVTAPLLILILMIIFAVLGIYKYNSKTLDAI